MKTVSVSRVVVCRSLIKRKTKAPNLFTKEEEVDCAVAK